ncbi:MAG: hypothetical protein KAR25_06375 [Methanosarcinales archaeon]|nr:hypothetical protein [Methanosarcinales archaeon]
MGWVYRWSGNEYRDLGRRDTHRSARTGSALRQGILSRERAGMVRGECDCLHRTHPLTGLYAGDGVLVEGLNQSST